MALCSRGNRTGGRKTQEQGRVSGKTPDLSQKGSWKNFWLKVHPRFLPCFCGFNYLVPLLLHLFQLDHQSVHPMSVHFAVLPQSRAFQLQLLFLLEVLQMSQSMSAAHQSDRSALAGVGGVETLPSHRRTTKPRPGCAARWRAPPSTELCARDAAGSSFVSPR